MDPTEADPWVPSEVVGVAVAVVAAVFVEAVVMSRVVAAAETAVAVVAAAVVAVAAPQGSASYVGAYDPGETVHFWVMLGADNPVSHALTDATIWQEKLVAYLLTRRGAIPFSTLWHGQLRLHLLCHRPPIWQLSMGVDSRWARKATIWWILPQSRRMIEYVLLHNRTQIRDGLSSHASRRRRTFSSVVKD